MRKSVSAKIAATILAYACWCGVSSAQAPEPLPNPNLQFRSAGGINQTDGMVLQSDGKIVIANASGDGFERIGGVVGKRRIARLNADGSLDSAFTVDANGPVYLRNGGAYIYAYGTFTMIGGVSRNGLARMSAATGLIDTAWAPEPAAANSVYLLAADSNNNVYVHGSGMNIGGLINVSWAKLDAVSGAGIADWAPAFPTPFNISAVAISQTALFVVGSTGSVTQTNRIYKVSTSTAAIDNTFSPNLDVIDFFIRVAVAGPNGDLFIASPVPPLFFNSSGGPTYPAPNKFLRLDGATGAVVPGWAAPATPGILGMVVTTDAVFAIRGESFGDSNSRWSAMRFDAATGLQSNAWPTAAFEQSTNFIMGALAATSTEVIIGGNFPFYSSVRRLGLAKLNASDGSVLPFAPDIVSTRVPFNPNATQLPDGGAVVAGDFAEIDGVPFDGLARIKPDGALDSSWQPPQVKGGITQLRALGNYLYLSGRFVQIGSTARNGFARLNISDGSLDAGFQPPVFNGVPSYFASDGNDVFVVGAFTTVDGNARFCAAKLNGITGAYLPQWAPSFQYVSSTTSNNCAGFQRMEAAGQFVYFATPNTLVTLKVGSFNRRLARVSTSTGVVDGGWDPNPTGTTSVGRMFVYSDSLYLAGSFTSIGGLSTKNIARYSTSAAGLIDATFTNNTDSLGSTCPSIGNIAAGPAGVYVSCVGGTTAQVSQRVRRFSLSNGALDTGWTPFTGTSSTTPFIAPLVQVLSSRDVMVYGGITKIGTMPRQAVAFLPATGRKTSLPILMYLLD